MLGIAQSGEGVTLEFLPSGVSGAQETDYRVQWSSVVLNGLLGGQREPEARKKDAMG